jgi:hypothetical protein
MDTARHKPFRSHAFINSCFGSKLSITLILERKDFLASFIARPRKVDAVRKQMKNNVSASTSEVDHISSSS